MELQWQKEERNDLCFKLALFCIVPFLAFLYSFVRLNTRSSHIILFICACLYAIAMSPDLTKGIDSVYYVNEFNRVKDLDSYYIKDLYFNYFSKNEYVKDLYAYTTLYVISRFTDNYHWMFLAFVVLPAIFCLKVLRYTTVNYKFSLLSVCILVIFISRYNMFSINGVRFIAATWLSIYLIVEFYRSNNYRYLILLPIIYFIHHSTLYVFFLFGLASFSKVFVSVNNKNKLIFAIFTSYFLGSYATEILYVFVDYLPSNVQQMVGRYTDASYMEFIHKDNITNSWQRRGEFAVRMYINLLVLTLIYYYDTIYPTNDNFIKRVFAFVVISLFMNNIFASIPAFGIRYLGYLIPFVVICIANANRTKFINTLLLLSPFVFFINAYVLFGYMRSTHSPSILYEPLPLFIYKYLLIP
ncbi:hypothetical protein CWE15_11520 [Aliidiomarina taiwanensis]|uniref:EpsG family protein n=1 Tax=Aliidiomarina taiwanensis TaxID=946228 RepID=A0A432WTJ2_9GAMM|nr:hypothetical protein CWE15_11520 [Aliidiomarina taiwanensis]